ncbi:MAG: SDR family NAD(P)-dependent oxidoreductase [Acidimicrobiales bacterium]
MSKLVEGKVALVTGAGRGIGREHALMLASHGAKVVVNDLGGDATGSGADVTPAQSVVAEIEAMGGEAVVNGGNVADFGAAKEMIDQAVDTFGGIDIVINNAGILRDRMIFSMTEDDWDAIMAVHLKGTFGPTHHAAVHWRNLSKAGQEVSGRIINTASPSGIYGNIGQTNYGAAKAGIAAFSVIAAMELAKYGVTVNCLAPAALSRMTADLMGGEDNLTEEQKEAMSPRWIAVIATWLCSDEAKNVTGRVFDVRGSMLGIAEQWRLGPSATQTDDPQDLGPIVAELMGKAALNPDMGGMPKEGPGRPGHGI